MNALFGHTGFVGSNLARSQRFDRCFNSVNVQEARGLHVDLLVCAGVRAEKWIANRDGAKDLEGINALLDVLGEVEAERAVLISTTDVYSNTQGRTERDPVDLTGMPYGVNRAYFEVAFRKRFPNCLVVRLPGLFGPGLKKNVVHDLIKDHEVEKLNTDGRHQYYDVRWLWMDIRKAMDLGIDTVNISTPPIQVEDLCAQVFKVRYHHPLPGAPVYDMRSMHDKQWGRDDGYLYGLEEVLSAMREFVDTHPERRPLRLPALV